MARPPKQVPATSGQGVSRKSYQMARSLRMKGAGASAGGANAPLARLASTPGITGGGVASGKRDYSKTEFVNGPINAEYTSREMGNPNLATLNALPSRRGKPPKGFLG